MLKKENRLKKHYQFNYVYRSGAHVSSNNVVLYFCTSKTKDIKVGFAVTKKIGKAHIRNLVRRRLREIMQKQIPSLKQNYNIIVVAKDQIQNASFATAESEICFLLKKANLIHDEKDTQSNN